MSAEAKIVWTGEVELTVEAEPREIASDLDERITQIWEDEKARRPEITNGSLVSVEEIDGGIVRGRLVEYRVFLARQRDPELRRLLPLRAVGVSGVVIFAGGDVLLGRRSAIMTEYPAAWELVPSGAIGGEALHDGRVEPLDVLLHEFSEETGIDRSAVQTTDALGIVHDRGQDGFDVCYVLALEGNFDDYRLASDEYDSLSAFTLIDASNLFATSEVVPTSRVLLELVSAR